MKSRVFLFISMMLAFVSIACGGPEITKEQYSAMHEKAKAAYSKVDKTGFAWSNSKKMISTAEKAAKSGDYNKAYTNARKSYSESNNAWQQYMDNKNADNVKL